MTNVLLKCGDDFRCVPYSCQLSEILEKDESNSYHQHQLHLNSWIMTLSSANRRMCNIKCEDELTLYAGFGGYA